MIRIDLPRPISTNSLYANVRGRGRIKSKRYCTWSCWAEDMLYKQNPIRKISGPVNVTIEIGEHKVSPLLDIDNTAKAYLDAIVKKGVIEDDNRKTIRSLFLEWVPGKEGATIIITKAESK